MEKDRSFATLSLDLFLVLMEVTDLTPAEIHKCRAVNKTWNLILSHPDFVNTLRRKRPEYVPVVAWLDGANSDGLEVDVLAGNIRKAGEALDWYQHQKEPTYEHIRHGWHETIIGNPQDSQHQALVRSMLTQGHGPRWLSGVRSILERNLPSNCTTIPLDWQKLRVVTPDCDISRMLTHGLFVTGSILGYAIVGWMSWCRTDVDMFTPLAWKEHTFVRLNRMFDSIVARVPIGQSSFVWNGRFLDASSDVFPRHWGDFKVDLFESTVLRALLNHLPHVAACVCIGTVCEGTDAKGQSCLEVQPLEDGPALFMSHRASVNLTLNTPQHCLWGYLCDYKDGPSGPCTDAKIQSLKENYEVAIEKNVDRGVIRAECASSIVHIYPRNLFPPESQPPLLSLKEIMHTCFYPCENAMAGMKHLRNEGE